MKINSHSIFIIRLVKLHNREELIETKCAQESCDFLGIQEASECRALVGE